MEQASKVGEKKNLASWENAKKEEKERKQDKVAVIDNVSPF